MSEQKNQPGAGFFVSSRPTLVEGRFFGKSWRSQDRKRLATPALNQTSLKNELTVQKNKRLAYLLTISTSFCASSIVPS